ncbi:hypothetical protein RLIN73S_06238 [Rhodanobacter lindaniclasticus]
MPSGSIAAATTTSSATCWASPVRCGATRHYVYSIDQYAQWYWHLAERWSLLLGVRHDEVRFRARDHYVTATNPDDSGGVDTAPPRRWRSFSPARRPAVLRQLRQGLRDAELQRTRLSQRWPAGPGLRPAPGAQPQPGAGREVAAHACVGVRCRGVSCRYARRAGGADQRERPLDVPECRPHPTPGRRVVADRRAGRRLADQRRCHPSAGTLSQRVCLPGKALHGGHAGGRGQPHAGRARNLRVAAGPPRRPTGLA